MDTNAIHGRMASTAQLYRQALHDFSAAGLRSGSATGSTLHEAIKCELYAEALQTNLLPFPEFQPVGKATLRLDMAWAEDTPAGWQIVAGFEIDKNASPRSIEKLDNLPKSARRFLVRFGSGKYRLPHNLLKRCKIEVIDVSAKELDKLTNKSDITSAKPFDNERITA